MASNLTVDSEQVSPGSRQRIDLPICDSLNGVSITMAIHVIRGAQSGPTLGLMSTSHGPEWMSIEQIRRALEQVDPSSLRGTILAVPVANPLALDRLTTVTPTDELNMNRIFPGADPGNLKLAYVGGVTELSAHLIASNVIDRADALLDLHLGGWGQGVECVDLPRQAEGDVRRRAEQMAAAIGDITVHEWDMPPGSAAGYAVSRGVAAVGMEIGGGGFGAERTRRWVEQGATAILRVMQLLGMIDRAPPAGGREQLQVTERVGIRPLQGGLHVPALSDDEVFGARVEAGQLLGQTFNPQTLELVEELRSPVDGIVYLARTYGPVYPGDWGYVVGLASSMVRFQIA